MPTRTPSKTLKKAFSHIQPLIGNTPMIEIIYSCSGEVRSVFVKCEHENFSGSIKDRMALHILKQACMDGKLQAGNEIVEATRGNTGVSLAAIGQMLGMKVTLLVTDWINPESVKVMENFGAEVIKISPEEGGLIRCIRKAEEMAIQDPNVFLPRQFSNIHNVDVHEKTTAAEIWKQLATLNIRPQAFVAGVGTGGTIMGVGRFLKKQHEAIRVHPLEPAGSPTLSTGTKQSFHRIFGLASEFAPGIVSLHRLDEIVQIHDGDAILMAQKLSTQLALDVGISSGANLIGAIKLHNQLGKNLKVVTVFSDGNEKYLNTFQTPEPVKDTYLTPQIQLLDYKLIPGALAC